ncbi:PTS system sucrose-specific IIC component [Entomoplasma freundtii]|uniref:PTS system, sucrose-specific IIABC component n=1 Tax=Entomoplasma freundtii TaxID=74700 RepID=A0A2K8NQW7_9MOLU|nr:PTS transporter subunit EIIC [Entomoplasma freundtii]ATZ16209.1 PTS system, sucrose-specific IIABC component [Entomoplasma freundtii]TDY56890.1 PTS system sucrose-specific IIC component [Entomoplasma freundtii]
MKKSEKSEKLVANILEKVGGSENIQDVYNCATRMRLTLRVNSRANIEELKKIEGISGALWSNGELQLIIGAGVSELTTYVKESSQKLKSTNVDFKTNNLVKQNVPLWKRFLKSVSAIFGPLIPFLVGVGLIMALQQILIRSGLASDPTKEGAILGTDYNIFDYVLNVIASTGFKMMGVIAMWSTVRYLGGNAPIAIALGLIMVSPIIPEAGIKLTSLGLWEIKIQPFYSTILAFIVIGALIAFAQRQMDKRFHPVANFILNPFLSLLIGGLLAFFIVGPIMRVVENALLIAFNWIMEWPFGLGALVVGLTWQPLVVLGVHNILFFAAVTDIVANGQPSLFLAAAFAAAWAQMGATIAVGLKSKRSIDKSAAFAAALPGIISGPTESCIYGINLPKGLPFITGVIAGGLSGWLIGIFNVRLDNLAGLGGIVGFLAYTENLVGAILIDLFAIGFGIVLTYLLWSEQKTEKTLAMKITRKIAKKEGIGSEIDSDAKKIIAIIKTNQRKLGNKEKNVNDINKVKNKFATSDSTLASEIDNFITNLLNNVQNKKLNQNLVKKLKRFKTAEQKQINFEYERLKKQTTNLRTLKKDTQSYAKVLAKTDNLEFKLKKQVALQEDQEAKVLVSKGKKAKVLFKPLKRKDRSEKREQQIIKLQTLINQNKQTINQLTDDINLKSDKHYSNIENTITNLESLTNRDFDNYKKAYFNAIHNIQISSNKLELKI